MDSINTFMIDSKVIEKSILEFCKVPSFSQNGIAIRTFQELFNEGAKRLSFESIWIELKEELYLLLLRKNLQAKRRVLFVCHADVAKGADGCNIRSEAGRLFAPGAADMKGGIALLLHALSYFETLYPASTLGIDVAVVPDEESGSRYSKEALKAIAKEATYAFVLEPCYEDGSFVSTRSGSLTLQFSFKGISRHAGRSKEREGHALYAAARLTLWIEEEMQESLATNVGLLQGGKESSTTAEEALLVANIRPDSIELRDTFLKRLEKKIATLEKESGCQIEVKTVSERPPKAASKELEHLLERACSSLNIPFSIRHSRGVTDGNDIASLGIPTIDTLGVVGGALHSKNEYLLLSSLEERCRLLLLLLVYLNEEPS